MRHADADMHKVALKVMWGLEAVHKVWSCPIRADSDNNPCMSPMVRQYRT